MPAPPPHRLRHVYWLGGRGDALKIAGSTSDPERVRRNLAERDRLFTARLREETRRLGLRAIEVDATMTEADVAGRVTEAFEL